MCCADNNIVFLPLLISICQNTKLTRALYVAIGCFDSVARLSVDHRLGGKHLLRFLVAYQQSDWWGMGLTRKYLCNFMITHYRPFVVVIRFIVSSFSVFRVFVFVSFYSNGSQNILSLAFNAVDSSMNYWQSWTCVNELTDFFVVKIWKVIEQFVVYLFLITNHDLRDFCGFHLLI